MNSALTVPVAPVAADEVPVDGVDDTSGLGRGLTFAHGPRAHFLDAGGEVSLQTKQLVGRTDQAIEPGLFHANVGQENLLVFVG